MKKIINGLAYNTETAEYICEAGNDLPYSDFQHEDSRLYRTKNGRYFLCGCGGAMSRFAVALDSGGACGRDTDTIVAICDEEARQLVERHGDSDDYVRCFGEPEEA